MGKLWGSALIAACLFPGLAVPLRGLSGWMAWPSAAVLCASGLVLVAGGSARVVHTVLLIAALFVVLTLLFLPSGSVVDMVYAAVLLGAAGLGIRWLALPPAT